MRRRVGNQRARYRALLELGAGAVLYVDNDPMLKALAPHAAELGRRLALADPLGDALRLTDKSWQLRVARECGLAVPRSWFPRAWEEIQSLKTRKRLIAKPLDRADFKALIAPNGGELAAALRRRVASAADVVVRQVREMTRRLAKTSGARGAFCAEFQLDAQDGRYYFIEWNPRPAYFQSIGWHAGFDLAWLAYCDHADPPRLAAIEPAFSGDHYWINVAADLRNLSKGPRRTAATWRPYLGPAEWALLALDDLAPWRKSLRQLASSVFTRKFFRRALGRPVTRRA